MIKSKSVTKKQREFIPKLSGWLSAQSDDSVWVMGSRMRERAFFIDLLRKVELLGEYTDIDEGYLNWITKEYYKRER